MKGRGVGEACLRPPCERSGIVLTLDGLAFGNFGESESVLTIVTYPYTDFGSNLATFNVGGGCLRKVVAAAWLQCAWSCRSMVG
jgi:hypothetical protein